MREHRTNDEASTPATGERSASSSAADSVKAGLRGVGFGEQVQRLAPRPVQREDATAAPPSAAATPPSVDEMTKRLVFETQVSLAIAASGLCLNEHVHASALGPTSPPMVPLLGFSVATGGDLSTMARSIAEGLGMFGASLNGHLHTSGAGPTGPAEPYLMQGHITGAEKRLSELAQHALDELKAMEGWAQAHVHATATGPTGAALGMLQFPLEELNRYALD